jgi:hypothetical protein
VLLLAPGGGGHITEVQQRRHFGVGLYTLILEGRGGTHRSRTGTVCIKKKISMHDQRFFYKT